MEEVLRELLEEEVLLRPALRVPLQFLVPGHWKGPGRTAAASKVSIQRVQRFPQEAQPVQILAHSEQLRPEVEQPRPAGARKRARQPPREDALSPGRQVVWSQWPELGQEQRCLPPDGAAGRYAVAQLQQEQQTASLARQLPLQQGQMLLRLGAGVEQLKLEAEEQRPLLDAGAPPWRQPLPACAQEWL